MLNHQLTHTQLQVLRQWSIFGKIETLNQYIFRQPVANSENAHSCAYYLAKFCWISTQVGPLLKTWSLLTSLAWKRRKCIIFRSIPCPLPTHLPRSIVIEWKVCSWMGVRFVMAQYTFKPGMTVGYWYPRVLELWTFLDFLVSIKSSVRNMPN